MWPLKSSIRYPLGEGGKTYLNPSDLDPKKKKMKGVLLNFLIIGNFDATRRQQKKKRRKVPDNRNLFFLVPRRALPLSQCAWLFPRLFFFFFFLLDLYYISYQEFRVRGVMDQNVKKVPKKKQEIRFFFAENLSAYDERVLCVWQGLCVFMPTQTM